MAILLHWCCERIVTSSAGCRYHVILSYFGQKVLVWLQQAGQVCLELFAVYLYDGMNISSRVEVGNEFH